MSKKKNDLADEPLEDKPPEEEIDAPEDNQPVAIKTTVAPTPELIALKLTAAVAIDGQVFRKDSIVHLTETEAKRLLHRGKADLASEE
jgi:hypothetical protein